MKHKRPPLYAALMCGCSYETIATAMPQMTPANWEYFYGPLPELKGPSK